MTARTAQAMGRRRRGDPVSGWLVLDKPAGPTSTTAVNRCRWLLNAQKAGHAGTLDPLASGILPIAFGEATKCINFLTDATKTYRFTIRFGTSTTTDDGEGEVLAESASRPVPDDITALLDRFTGDILQVPPAFSAIKIDGQRAYDLARDGQPPEMKARPVQVERLSLLGMPDDDHAELEMVCGKGTYVRSLARDIGALLGIPAHASAIRRTAVGSFEESGSISLATFEGLCHKRSGLEALKPVETALDDIPALAVTGEQADRMRHGQAVRVLNFTYRDDELICAMHDQRPVALARYRAEWVEPVRVFNL